MPNDQTTISVPHEIRRVRHDLKCRMLRVSHVRRLSPKMVRVTLTGDDLAGFVSAGFDDHVKLFFPPEGSEKPVLPTLGANGPVFPEGAERPDRRDYTPRSYDAARNELAIDFALHESGPATKWAESAEPGQFLGVAGPRGSFVVPVDFDWHLLVGDETALPAIGRRLEELPAGTRAIVVAEVDGPADEIALTSAAPLDSGGSIVRAARRANPRCSTGVSANSLFRRARATPGSPASPMSPRRCAGGCSTSTACHASG